MKVWKFEFMSKVDFKHKKRIQKQVVFEARDFESALKKFFRTVNHRYTPAILRIEEQRL